MALNKKLHVVGGDLHIPFQDKALCKQFLQFIKDEQPGTVHLLGDVCDFYAISRFSKDPLRKETFQEELDEVGDFLGELRGVYSGRVIFTRGNHEFRAESYLSTKAPELASLRALRLPELLSFDEHGIDFKDERTPYRIGPLLLTHGTLVRKWSGMSAKAHFEKYGCSVIHQHTHRIGAFYHTYMDVTHAAYENGCLCSTDPDYEIAPDWQQGWAVVHANRGFFHVDQVPVVQGRFMYQGQLYGRKRVPAGVAAVIEDVA